jgi:signal transduction histidine kinase
MNVPNPKELFKIVTRPTAKWQIKVFLGVSAMILVVGTIFMSIFIVNQLIDKEKRIIETYSHLHQKLINPDANAEDIILLMDSITPNITSPIIMTDENDSANYPYEIYTLNVDIDKKLSREAQRVYMQDLVMEMGKTYPPVVVKEASGKVLFKFYYKNSRTIDILKYFPYFAILMIGGIIVIGYLAFSNIRRNEEQKVWVGMAKEAAHQLGTPLSSLMAWVEILRMNIDNPQSISDTSNEMLKDIHRLNTIANRFSKIGSKPELTKENLTSVIDKACTYFEKRLPHLGRKVNIIREFGKEKYIVNLNIDLFTWVLENLIKNAAEAIEQKKGEIHINIFEEKDKLIITIKDNGKGMNKKLKSQVFNPGFTTKTRGWGLGLSLCKRIIEQYHNGKIFIKDSSIGKGTTFQIELQRINLIKT